jgi:aryl-alcohol dehydrogenase-like predicted oxidoreductase
MMLGEMIDAKDAERQLDRAVERGVNFIDTGEMYPVPLRPTTFGLTETIIGNWMRARRNRDRLILSTKCVGPPPRDVIGPTSTLAYIREGRTHLDRVNLRAAIEGSLQRLGTDYVDLYQPHWPDRVTNDLKKLGYVHDPVDDPVPIEETLDALGELVREGKVRVIGLSNETPWGLSRYLSAAESLDVPRVVSISNAYNLLCRTFEVGLAEFAHREAVGLLAYSPLGMGVLSGKYLGGARPEGARLSLYPHPRYTQPAAVRATQAYVSLAAEAGMDPAAMALAFVAGRPFTTSTLIGATSLEQLNTDIDACAIRLPDDLLTAIEAIHGDNSNPGP